MRISDWSSDVFSSDLELFSPRQIVNFGQRHAFALIRLGDGAAAEKAFRPLVAEMTRLVGRDHPDTLFLRLNVGQALMVQQRYPEAITIGRADGRARGCQSV